MSDDPRSSGRAFGQARLDFVQFTALAAAIPAAALVAYLSLHRPHADAVVDPAARATFLDGVLQLGSDRAAMNFVTEPARPGPLILESGAVLTRLRRDGRGAVSPRLDGAAEGAVLPAGGACAAAGPSPSGEEQILLRVDWPEGRAAPASGAEASVTWFGNADCPVPAQVVGSIPGSVLLVGAAEAGAAPGGAVRIGIGDPSWAGVPFGSVLNGPQGPHLWVVQGRGRFQLRPISQDGLKASGGTWLVRDAVAPGERVVTRGAVFLDHVARID